MELRVEARLAYPELTAKSGHWISDVVLIRLRDDAIYATAKRGIAVHDGYLLAQAYAEAIRNDDGTEVMGEVSWGPVMDQSREIPLEYVEFWLDPYEIDKAVLQARAREI